MGDQRAWNPVAEQVWVYSKRVNAGWNLQSYAVKLADGGLLIHSPTKSLPDSAHEELQSLGPVRWLCAPNYYHHLGLPEWKQRYQSARIVCSDVARTRLAGKHPELEFGSLTETGSVFPQKMQWIIPPSIKTGEVFLSVPGAEGPSWIVCDAFFHVNDAPSGLMGLFLRWTKTVPGVCIGRTFTALAVQDSKAYRSWLEEVLQAEKPAKMLPSHGETLEPKAWEAMIAVTHNRLG